MTPIHFLQYRFTAQTRVCRCHAPWAVLTDGREAFLGAGCCIKRKTNFQFKNTTKLRVNFFFNFFYFFIFFILFFLIQKAKVSRVQHLNPRWPPRRKGQQDLVHKKAFLHVLNNFLYILILDMFKLGKKLLIITYFFVCC